MAGTAGGSGGWLKRHPPACTSEWFRSNRFIRLWLEQARLPQDRDNARYPSLVNNALTLAGPAGVPVIPGSDGDRVAALTAAWLARRTANTQREYRRDLGHWLAWCNRLGIAPLAARMMHMDAWI